MNNTISDMSFSQLAELVTAQTGLHIRPQDNKTFRKAIGLRMKLLKLTEPEEYYQFLKADSAESDLEWKELAAHLATGESYFFRDKGQFNLMKNWILPELIERNKSKRTLRIWSAGCSTGEEPYSLAMVIDELLPYRGDWNIFILGIDMNEEAIGKARRGIYRSWSFRTMEPDLQKRYFHKRQNEWELDERIRTMVTFHYGNLLKDTFPSNVTGIHNMDLIFCRNVFIYFDRNAVSVVLKKFVKALNEGGYLITGHAEIHAQSLGLLRARCFPESVVYQRGGDVPVETNGGPLGRPVVKSLVALPSPVPTHVSGSGAQNTEAPEFTSHQPHSEMVHSPSLLTEAEVFFRDGAYGGAMMKLEPLLQDEPQNFQALDLMARACANLGESERAARYCKQALAVNPFAVQPYYLLAHVAEEQGDTEQAKSFLKKALYLSPSFIPAYLDLGALYEREEDSARARKMRATALEFLKAMPPHFTVEPYEELTAGELSLYVQKMLGKGNS